MQAFCIKLICKNSPVIYMGTEDAARFGGADAPAWMLGRAASKACDQPHLPPHWGDVKI